MIGTKYLFFRSHWKKLHGQLEKKIGSQFPRYAGEFES